MFKYPHGDLHGLNLDWFLEEWKNFKDSLVNKFTASSTTVSASAQPDVTVVYDDNTGIYDFTFEIPENAKPTQTNIGYQAGSSATTPPTGTWLASPPAVPQGQYLWTKNAITYNTGFVFTFYAVARQGVDGNPVLHFVANVPQGNAVTINDSRITADMRVINVEWQNPANIYSDVTWTTVTGSLTLNGTFANATVVNIDIVKTI